MNTILFAESMEIEFNHIFTECDNAIAYANARLMEDGLIPSYIREAGNNVKQGGLFGFIKRMFDAILRMLSDASKKFKSLLFGSQLDSSKADEKIQCDRNPNGVIQILNGEIPKYKDFLKKCMNGEVSVEEAKAFCSEKSGAFAAIGSTVLSAGALFGISKTTDKYINKWKNDVEEAFEVCSDNIRELSEKGARTEGGIDPKTIEQATQIVLNHMSEITGTGIKSIEKNIRELYVKNYVTARMEKNVQQLSTAKGRREAKREAAQRTRETKREINKLNRLDENIKKGTKSRENIDASDKRNRARLNQKKNDVYVNSNRYVEEDDL